MGDRKGKGKKPNKIKALRKKRGRRGSAQKEPSKGCFIVTMTS